MNNRVTRAVGRLYEIMATLRSPEGCPWDAVQTPESLQRYLVEETYEVLDALDRGDAAAIRDELGDLLLQIVFQARIFEERGDFGLAEVAEAIADKLVRRHPHVFAGQKPGDVECLAAQWNRIKEEERRTQGEDLSADRGRRALPALIRARKAVEKGAATLPPMAASECVEESRIAMKKLAGTVERPDPAEVEDAFGDLLFALVRLAHTLHLDAEQALRRKIDRVDLSPP